MRTCALHATVQRSLSSPLIRAPFTGVRVRVGVLPVGDAAADVRLVRVRAGGFRDVVFVGLHDQNAVEPFVLRLHAGARIRLAGIDHHVLLYVHHRVHTGPQQRDGRLQYQHSVAERG